MVIDRQSLVARIQESGLLVYGFGVRQAAREFVVACDKFVFLDD